MTELTIATRVKEMHARAAAAPPNETMSVFTREQHALAETVTLTTLAGWVDGQFTSTRTPMPPRRSSPRWRAVPHAESQCRARDRQRRAQEQPSDPIRYTPVWDVTPVKWTDAAIAAGKRVQFHSQADVLAQVQSGNLISALPGTPNQGLGGVNAIGAISSCPIIAVFPG